MTLDWQQIVNLLITAGFACVGVFLRTDHSGRKEGPSDVERFAR